MDFEKLIKSFEQLDPDIGVEKAREKANYLKWQLKSMKKELNYENIY